MPPTRLLLVALLVAPALSPSAFGQGPRQPGERYALLIGVRDYVNKELKGLNYPEPDVVDVARLLRADGYRSENLVIMSQTQSKHSLRFVPEGAKIVKELKELLRDKNENDTVLVGFTGHGVQFRGEEELYLCPADARLTDRSSLIAVSEVYRQLEDCKAGFKLLLVDACRNDPLSNLAKSASTEKLESVTQPRRKAPPGGIVAMFSCSPGEQSFEHDGLKHGVFFNFVIDSLRGSADFDNSGKIEVEELVHHVRTRVNNFVRANLNNTQRPEFQGKVRDDVVLATVSKTRTVALSGGFAAAASAKPSSGNGSKAPAKFTTIKGPSAADVSEASDHLKKAHKYLNQGMCEEAIDECNEALTLARGDDGIAALAYYQLAEACGKLGDESGRKFYFEMGDKRRRGKK